MLLFPTYVWEAETVLFCGAMLTKKQEASMTSGDDTSHHPKARMDDLRI